MNSRNRVVWCFSFIIARSACVVLFAVLTCLLSACSPTYVLRAGYEEAKILWHRRPIEEVLRRSDLDVATREKLELVLRVRRFAEEDLAFTVGGSYSSITELASPPVVYVVTAAPRTKLEPYTWWFPIVGRVAYKGYFDADAAKQEAQRLEAKGYDTYIRTAVAFSTLGWFSDPLLPPLLRYETETLTNVIIHELFHNTFYLSGQTALNESLANFAGHRGAIAFFAKEQGNEEDATRHAVATWESELAVSNFLAEGAERLNALYASSIAEADKLRQREDLFARLQEDFRNLPGPVRQNTDFASVKLNNAVVLQYLVYLKELALFEQVYQQNEQNLPTTLARITAAAKKEDDPFAGVRALASVSSDSFLPLLASFGDLGIIPELRCKQSWESAGLQVADCGDPTSLACCAGGRDASEPSVTPGQSRRYGAKDSTLG
jgi:predicted aminopeptidase